MPRFPKNRGILNCAPVGPHKFRNRLVGVVILDSSIMKAIEEFKVPANQRGRLIAQRRD
jgi:hypothetical protein